LVGHRLLPLPVAGGVAIIGNARIGAATGPGQHEKSLMAVDEILERAEGGHGMQISYPGV
jgi:hypothetical protein